MKQEKILVSDITGKIYATTALIETNSSIFAQEERTIDEICNDGDISMREFIDNNANHKHHLVQLFPERKI